MSTERDENKAQANRAYALMFDAARENLLKREPAELAAAAGGVYHTDSRLLQLQTIIYPLKML